MWVAQDCAMANVVASMLEKTTCMYGYNHNIKIYHLLKVKHYGWCTPKLFERFNCESKVKTTEG
jgi:hypothetical protein